MDSLFLINIITPELHKILRLIAFIIGLDVWSPEPSEYLYQLLHLVYEVSKKHEVPLQKWIKDGCVATHLSQWQEYIKIDTIDCICRFPSSAKLNLQCKFLGSGLIQPSSCFCDHSSQQRWWASGLSIGMVTLPPFLATISSHLKWAASSTGMLQNWLVLTTVFSKAQSIPCWEIPRKTFLSLPPSPALLLQ